MNAEGNADTSADDSIPVTIKVIKGLDDDTVHPTVTFSLSNPNSGTQPHLDLNHPVVGYTVNLNTELHNLPAGGTPVYDWHEGQGYVHNWADRFHTSHYPAQGLSAGSTTYTVHIKWDGGGITAKHDIEWFNPDGNHPGPGN